MILSLLALSLLSACSGCGSATRITEGVQNSQKSYTTPKEYGYIVKATHPHSTKSYTQGLQYYNGVMWEGTGQYGESVVQTIDLKSGEKSIRHRLPSSQFGEGITILNDTLYQLTWYANTAYLYDIESGKELKRFNYPNEGWGITNDGEWLYMSDGSERIYQIDPATFKRVKSITVLHEGSPLHYINELEFIDGKIWANIYLTDAIVIIEPSTGEVEGVIDLTGILPQSERTASTDVLNGIAYDKDSGRIFVTGKYWSRLFEIEIVEK